MLVDWIFLINPNTRGSVLPNIANYAPKPRWQYHLFHIYHKTNPSIVGTLDYSCTQVSITNIISISFEIQLKLGPLFHGNPYYSILPREDPQHAKFLFVIIFLSLSRITTFIFFISVHFTSFLDELYFLDWLDILEWGLHL